MVPVIREALGPVPTRSTPTLAPARARVAAALEESGGAVTLATLAERLGGHPNATRAHLDALVADGHAEAHPLPPSGPGRPALAWTLTGAGRRALAGDPVITAYAELVSAMAQGLSQEPDGAGRARAIGCAWGVARASLPAHQDLVDTLADLGFGPDAEGPAIRLRTCPILDAAAAHPEVVCAIHAGLVEGVTGRRDLRLIPFAEPGACRIEL